MPTLPILGQGKMLNGDLIKVQTRWSEIINPILINPSLKNLVLPSVQLVAGKNVINHTLGRTLLGWRVIRLNAPAQIYDQQTLNQMPEKTLILMSNLACTIFLEVF
jgi:hypothetical protein